MKLSQLFSGIATNQFTDEQITGIERDSRMVDEGKVFFAIKGVDSDGHDYAIKALELGAAAVVVERDLGIEKQVIVEDSKKAYALACGNYFGNPSRELKLIGITGTNGKTTSAYIVKNILENLGKKTGLIGTIENLIGDMSLQARYTTPDPYILQGLFRRMVDAGCEYTVMEVSSHGLDQGRLEGCHFIAGGFTNLTQDHLDYHGTMENYFGAKIKLFGISEHAVVNIDDDHGKILAEELGDKALTFSVAGNTADYSAHDISFSREGSNFILKHGREDYAGSFTQPGIFSVSNAVMGVVLCTMAGLPLDDCVRGLAGSKPIPGRFEIIHSDDEFTVIRDFAHATDGLEKLLSTIRSFFDGRLITVFGAAGERDRTKRPSMGAAVARYSDLSILTTDNPRKEPNEQILNDVKQGLVDSGKEYKVFGDRLDAIHWALGQLRHGDYLILAGKGHEDYQVLSYGTINFNERQIVLDYLSKGAE